MNVLDSHLGKCWQMNKVGNAEARRRWPSPSACLASCPHGATWVLSYRDRNWEAPLEALCSHAWQILAQQKDPPCSFMPCGYLEGITRSAKAQVLIMAQEYYADYGDLAELYEILQRPTGWAIHRIVVGEARGEYET